LFPMCGMNLAFERTLIGPAMYFGLMGDGQPIGRYDDMWAGWCCKVYDDALFLLIYGTMEFLSCFAECYAVTCTFWKYVSLVLPVGCLWWTEPYEEKITAILVSQLLKFWWRLYCQVVSFRSHS
jgi:hypothetical protein